MRQFIDQRFGDRYTLREQVGAGGMALVFRAWDDKLETDVALKVLKPELTDSGEVDVEDILRKFEQEIRVVVTVNHPHIVQILDRGQHEGLFYYVMRFVPGGSLAARIRERRGPLEIDEALQVLRQVGGALQRAHEAGVYHRDIKPSNILVEQSRGGDVDYFLADFGIAKAVEDTSLPAVTLSGSGTPGYMSPEQAFGDPFDYRTDVFSLGVATYEMVTGKRPFTGDSLTALMRAVTTQDPVPPSQHNPKVAPLLEAAILKAMKRSPEERFGSVREFVAACEAGAFARSFDATVPMRPPVQPPVRRRAGWLPLAAGLLAAAGIGWAAFTWWPGPSSGSVPPHESGASSERGPSTESGPKEPESPPQPGNATGPPNDPKSEDRAGDAKPQEPQEPTAQPEPTTQPGPAAVPAGGVLLCCSAGDNETLAEVLRVTAGEIEQQLTANGVARVQRLFDPQKDLDIAAKAQELRCDSVLHLRASAKLEDGFVGLSLAVELCKPPAVRDRLWTLGPIDTGQAYVQRGQRKDAYARLLLQLTDGGQHADPGKPTAGPGTFTALMPELLERISGRSR